VHTITLSNASVSQLPNPGGYPLLPSPVLLTTIWAWAAEAPRTMARTAASTAGNRLSR
jgi:hypothetical protein